MSRDKKILYASSFTLVLALLGALFLPRTSGRAITALILAIAAFAILKLVKKRPILDIRKKEVFLIMLAMGAVCLVVYYLTGVHFGFYKSSTPLSVGSFFKNIVPIAVIIIASEVIRYVLLAQKAKFMGLLAFVSGALSEVLVFSTLGYITTFNRFMDAVGLYMLPAVTANVLYNFLSKKYGFLPNIVYRLIMSLYLYVLPVYPQTPDSLYSFAKLVVPLLIYLFISALYAKRKNFVSHRKKAVGYISLGLSVAIMISIVLLISCEFRYRSLVIATESMTGEINKGDMIIYERYDGQQIGEGQVIVFLENNSKIVHRVVEIKNISGEVRYYTKGDANDDFDVGYRLSDDIVGLTDIKVSYVGYPTLWLREITKNLGKEGT